MVEVWDKLSISKEEYIAHLAYQVEHERSAITGSQRNWQQSFLAMIRIPKDAELGLDLGCGCGYWTMIINNICLWYGQCYGVDMCEEFINHAKEWYPHLADKYLVMDMHDLKFEDDKFDFVYADNVLEHSPKHDVVLKEIYRVLKKGGKLIALVPADKLGKDIETAPDHVWKVNKRDLQVALLKAGFSVKIDVIDVTKIGMNEYKPSKNIELLVEAIK